MIKIANMYMFYKIYKFISNMFLIVQGVPEVGSNIRQVDSLRIKVST